MHQMCQRAHERHVLVLRFGSGEPRPMNLVSRNLLSAKKDPPQDSSDPNRSGNQELDQRLCFTQRQETDAKHQPKRNTVFS